MTVPSLDNYVHNVQLKIHFKKHIFNIHVCFLKHCVKFISGIVLLASLPNHELPVRINIVLRMGHPTWHVKNV